MHCVKELCKPFAPEQIHCKDFVQIVLSRADTFVKKLYKAVAPERIHFQEAVLGIRSRAVCDLSKKLWKSFAPERIHPWMVKMSCKSFAPEQIHCENAVQILCFPANTSICSTTHNSRTISIYLIFVQLLVKGQSSFLYLYKHTIGRPPQPPDCPFFSAKRGQHRDQPEPCVRACHASGCCFSRPSLGGSSAEAPVCLP